MAPPLPPNYKTRNNHSTSRKQCVAPDDVGRLKRRSQRGTLSTEKQATHSLQEHPSNVFHIQSDLVREINLHKELESWEGVSPSKPDLALRSNLRGLVASTPKQRRRGPRKPLHDIAQRQPSSLPPSSPPLSSSQDKAAVEQLKEDADPFGFFGAEKRLKARKPIVRSPKRKRNLPMEESSSSGGHSLVGEAFAAHVATTALHDQPESTFLPRRKRPAPGSPSASSNLMKSSSEPEPSSPCQRVVKRKSESGRKAVEENKGKKSSKKCKLVNTAPEDPKLITLELEALLPKHRRKRVGQPSPATAKAGKTRAPKARGRKATEKAKAEITVLSHLDDEDREKFQRERAKRLRYYEQLDAYHIEKEKVRIV